MDHMHALRLVPTSEYTQKILEEIPIYKTAADMFGNRFAIP